MFPVSRIGDKNYWCCNYATQTLDLVSSLLQNYHVHFGSWGLERGRAHPMDPKGFGNSILIKTPHPPKSR